MDNKTIGEIIQKRISEIQEIAQNFTKPEPIYQIDIDLALSKTRLMYNELLTLGKVAEPHKIIPVIKPQEEEVEEVIPEPIVEKPAEVEKESKQRKEEVIAKTEVVNEEDDDSFEEDNFDEEELDDILNEEPLDSLEEEEAEDDKEEEDLAFELVEDNETQEQEPEAPKQEEKQKTAKEPAKVTEPKKQQPSLFEAAQEKAEKKIVADQFASQKESVNDIMARIRKETDLASHYKLKPVKDIKTALSLNDKIMIIKNLFRDDADGCNAAIDHLNGLENLDQALYYVSGLDIDSDKDSLEKFLEVIYRRFL